MKTIIKQWIARLAVMAAVAALSAAPPARAATPAWHFECSGGVPNKLCWQTKTVEVGQEAAGRVLGDAAAVVGDFDFRHAFRDLQPDVLRRCDLEHPDIEGEPLDDLSGRRERLFDGGDQVFGVAVEMAGGFPPFGQGAVTQGTVTDGEVEGGVAKLLFELAQLVVQIIQPGVGDEATDAAQEWEAGAFDGGLHPGLDQGECLEGVARDQALVTELDEAVGDVGGIKPEVFGVEAFATAPVTDGGCDEDPFAADAIEEGLGLVLGLGLGGVHIGCYGWGLWGLGCCPASRCYAGTSLVCVFRGEWKRPPRSLVDRAGAWFFWGG